MNISFNSMTCSQVDTLIMYLLEDNLETPNEEINKVIDSLEKRDLFKGKEGQSYIFNREVNSEFQTVILMGLGKEENLSLEIIRKTVGKSIKKCKELKLLKIFLRVPNTNKLSVKDMAKAFTY